MSPKTAKNKQGFYLVEELAEAQKYKSADEFVKAKVNNNDEVSMNVPVNLLRESEPSMAAEHLKGAAKRQITEPIEVIHNITPQAQKEYGEWVVMEGHHRLEQAKINGDTFIPAKVTHLETYYEDGEEVGNHAVTKSQLTDIWNKAQVEPKTTETVKELHQSNY